MKIDMYDIKTKRIIDNGGTVFFTQSISFLDHIKHVRTGESFYLDCKVLPEVSVGRPIIWISKNDRVACIDEHGLIQTHSVGETDIIVKSDYGKDRCRLIVEKGLPLVDVSNYLDLILTDKQYKLNATVLSGEHQPSFISMDPNVITISATGMIDIIGVGETFIRISCNESDNYLKYQKLIPVTVREKPLDLVTITKINNHSKGVYISWNPISAAEGYYIYREEKGCCMKRIATVSRLEVCSIIDSTVMSEKEYSYSIRAFNKIGISPDNQADSVIQYLSAPKSITAQRKKDFVLLQWDSVKGADGYNIFRSTNGQKKEPIAEVGDNIETVYLDKNVNDGMFYLYSIEAKKHSGACSSADNNVSLMFIQSPVLTSLKNGNHYVRIDWKKVDKADSYIIYRRKDKMEWKFLAATIDNVFRDKTVQCKSNYSYKVCAVKNGKEGPVSNESNIIWYLDIPKLESVIKMGEALQVSWNSVVGADEYIVFRQIDKEHWQRLDIVSGNANTKYLDKDIIPNKEYIYTVRARHEKSDSHFDARGVKGIIT